MARRRLTVVTLLATLALCPCPSRSQVKPIPPEEPRKIAEEEVVRRDLLAEAERTKQPVEFLEFGPNDLKSDVHGWPAVRVRYRMGGTVCDVIHRVEKGEVRDVTHNKKGRYWREAVKGVEPFLNERPQLPPGMHYGPAQNKREKEMAE